jgi:phosphate-selective porin OprO/OprP
MSDFKTAGRTGFAAILFASVAGAALAGPIITQPPAPPPEDPRDARINQLEDEVRELTGDVQTLSDEVTDLKRGAAAQAAVDATIPPKPTGLVAFPGGKPTISSADGKFTVSLKGVMQLDSGAYFQGSPGPVGTAAADTDHRRSGPALGATSSNTDWAHARDLKDGDVFRRARIGLDGTAFGDWDYRFVYDFGGSGVENSGQVYETWVQYSGFKPAHIRIGAFAPQIGMEDQASTNTMPFIERTVDADLARGLAAGDTRTGAAVWANGPHWLVSGAVTGRTIGVLNTGTASATAQSFGDQLGLVGRFAGTPFHGDDWQVHLGVHGSYVIHPPSTVGPNSLAPTVPTAVNNRVVAFSNTPELRVDGTKLINTGNIDANNAGTFGVEAAFQKANFLVQGEYDDFFVQRSDGTLAAPVSNPNFSGWYVEGLWTITGEPRKYNAATGAFDGPAVTHPFDPFAGAWGVWELGLRYSDMNLNFDGGAPGTFVISPSTIRGGNERNLSVALGWYPNSVVHFLLDYEYVTIDRLSPATSATGSGNSSASWMLPGPGLQIGQTFSAIALRSQVAF